MLTGIFLIQALGWEKEISLRWLPEKVCGGTRIYIIGFDMKKHPWLNVAENVSLVGLGVGSVATLIFKEILYTTTPLSLLVALGLLNRRRTEQEEQQEMTAALTEIDQRFTQQIVQIQHQVKNVPAPGMIQKLKKGLLQKNWEVAKKLYEEMNTMQEATHQRLQLLEQQGVASVRQKVQQLDEKYAHFDTALAQVREALSRMDSADRLDQLHQNIDRLSTEMSDLQHHLQDLSNQTQPSLSALQDHVSRIDRQLGKLPPPIDVSSLRQEMTELVKVIADLVPKRDFTAVTGDVKELQLQQQQLQQSVQAIEAAAINLKQVLSGLPHSLEEVAAEGRSVNLYPDLQELVVGYLTHLQTQLTLVQDAADHLAQQQQQMREQVGQLPKAIDLAALQRQFQELSGRLPDDRASTERLQAMLQQEIDAINQRLHQLTDLPQCELVFDLGSDAPELAHVLTGSRAVLEEALESSRDRLIVIWPWSSQCRLDDLLLQKIETFLSHKRHLDLGWCHRADRSEERLLGKIRRGWMMDATQQGALQETLQRLLKLKRAYPDYFQFKILGTSENFLVSDQSFAVLGITDVLNTSTAFSELQLKLRTRDAEVIQRLTRHFDNPALEDTDIAAYWNRAVTHYDLGDKAGAIADYTHILSVEPNDIMSFNYRGLAHYDQGNVEAALADFGQSIHLSPYQSAVYCNRGFIRSELGDQRGALTDYSLAIQAKPDLALAYFYRGMAWQKLEDHREAVADYGEAIYFDPQSAVAHYYRGIAWQKLGNLQNATSDLETAAELFMARGSKTNAQKALKSLAKLRQEISANGGMPVEPPPAAKKGTEPAVETIDSFFEEVVAESVQNGQNSQPVPAAPDVIAIPDTPVPAAPELDTFHDFSQPEESIEDSVAHPAASQNGNGRLPMPPAQPSRNGTVYPYPGTEFPWIAGAAPAIDASNGRHEANGVGSSEL